MSRGHVHQQVYNWRCQEAICLYINADILVHEYGLVNHTRRQWAASHQQARIYVRKEHLSLVYCQDAPR